MSETRAQVAGVPDVLHICRGCGSLASGECEWCARAEAARAALRAAEFYAGLPRVEPPEPVPAPNYLARAAEWLVEAGLFALAVIVFWFAKEPAEHTDLI